MPLIRGNSGREVIQTSQIRLLILSLSGEDTEKAVTELIGIMDCLV
jgi:hypothetical protein